MTDLDSMEATPILEDFESLGLLSRNCFDLLVKIMVGVALGCDRISLLNSFRPIMHAAPCSMRSTTTFRSGRSGTSLATNDLFPGENAQDEPTLSTIAQAI